MPDLHQLIFEVDVDEFTGAVFADAELLPGHPDHPIPADPAGDPCWP